MDALGATVASLGPVDPLRSVEARALLPEAIAAAEAAGVSRLADVTRLDRIGLPVWQAVRPMSRALSVHQGKGATPEDAQLGALLEAVESDAAEQFVDASTKCPFDSLPRLERPATIADFAAHRDQPPSAVAIVHWVTGDALPGCAAVRLPLPLVSLDFTRFSPSPYDRASNGIATAATRGEAITVALHELIERDAVTEWCVGNIGQRIASTVAPASIPFDWYRELERRIGEAGARLSSYRVPSLTGTPVFACEINDARKDAPLFRTANGRGAHALPEIALFKAVAEACQVRATFIAGARDDLFPERYSEEESSIRIAFGLPPPPGMTGIDFHDIPAGPQTPDALCAALVARGYWQGTVVMLQECRGLCTVRLFVAGLGSLTRRRRVVAD